jgi:hypothetical protein
MPKKRSSKIFIRYNGELCDFMRAMTGSDGSVMFNFVGNGMFTTEAIFDESLGELREGNFIEEKTYNKYSKISFHTSGICKLSNKVGRPSGSLDRCTIIGIPLREISTPRRIMEILLPNRLKITSVVPTERDIVLDGTGFYQGPLRCTISCFRNQASQPTFDRVVSTSMCEYSNGLEFNSLIWLFTLRISEQDHVLPEHLRFFVPGKIKWSNQS